MYFTIFVGRLFCTFHNILNYIAHSCFNVHLRVFKHFLKIIKAYIMILRSYFVRLTHILVISICYKVLIHFRRQIYNIEFKYKHYTNMYVLYYLYTWQKEEIF